MSQRPHGWKRPSGQSLDVAATPARVISDSGHSIAGEPQQPAGRGGRPVTVLFAAGVFAVFAFVMFGFEPVLPGGQVVGPALSVASAAGDGWVPMDSSEASGRAGFPEPMLRMGSELCIGFGRVDFPTSQRRPSLARCVDATDLPRGQSSLMTLESIPSGHDTWHFVVVGGTVEDLDVAPPHSGGLTADRIYIAGAVVALRMANGTVLESIEWKTEFGRFRCAPSPDAWTTGQFCDVSP